MTRPPKHKRVQGAHPEEVLIVDEYLAVELSGEAREHEEGIHHERLEHNEDAAFPRGWWITVYRLYCCCGECEGRIVNIEVHSVVFCEGGGHAVFRWNHAPRERMTDSEVDFLRGLEEEHKELCED